jgi:hypothetical protein
MPFLKKYLHYRMLVTNETFAPEHHNYCKDLQKPMRVKISVVGVPAAVEAPPVETILAPTNTVPLI